MASHSIEPIQLETWRLAKPRVLGWRIAGLAALFVTELLLISARTPHLALDNSPGLPGLVFDLGRWKVRLLVTIAVACLLFWNARDKYDFERLTTRSAARGVAWRSLFAHFAAALLFAGLTSLLFENRLQRFQANILVVAWVAAGTALVWFGATAFLPPGFWKTVLKATRDLWVYIAALVASGCVLASWATPLWNVMARWTLRLAWLMLQAFPLGSTVDAPARILRAGGFAVEVAPACSGYEGIGLILAFTVAWLWFFRKEWRFPHALLLIPAGVVTIWIFNAVRVAALVIIGAVCSPEIAMQGFHSHAGWISFNLVALGTCLAARRIPALNLASGGHTTQAAEPAVTNPTLPFLLPFLGILAAGMLASTLSGGFEWLYFLRVVATGGTLWHFRSYYRTLDWRIGWPSITIGVLAFLAWIGIEPLVHAPHSGVPIQLGDASQWARTVWIAVRILGAIITVPIAEELAFRGFLLRRLVSADFDAVAWRAFSWAPCLISSLAFGLLHGERWLAGTVAGILYAVAMTRRGRIGEAVTAHAVTNALLAVYVLATGNWQLW